MPGEVSKLEISTVVCSFKANFRVDLPKLAENFIPTEEIVGLRYINEKKGISAHIGDPCRGLKKKKKPTKNSVKNGFSLRVVVDTTGPISRYTTVNLFSTGSLNITGSIDVDRDPYVSRDIVFDYLRELPESIVSKKEAMDEYNVLEVANIKSKFWFKFDKECYFDKTEFYDIFTKYPGIEVRTFDRKHMINVPLPNTPRCMKVSIFRTGVIIMDSAKNKDEICYAYDCIVKMVFENWDKLVNRYEEVEG